MRNLAYVILLLFVGIRVFWYFNYLPYKDGDHIRITFVVREEPNRYSQSQSLNIQELNIQLPLYPVISYGDTVVVEGKVKDAKLVSPKLIKLIPGRGILIDLRRRVIGFYKNSLPLNDSALVAGMTLGSKEGLTKDFWEKLTSTGTAHVVVASGMNVSLVGGFVLGICLLFMGRRKALIFTAVSIWLYVLMSGFEAPIIRAAIMGSIAFFASSLGKVGHTARILIITGLVMLTIWPSFFKELGFWMSFLATLSLVLFSKRIEKRLIKLPSIIRQSLATSLAAQLGVGPILYFSFGQLNLFSPLINAGILWSVPIITIVSLFCGLMSLVAVAPARIALYLVYPLTQFFISVVSLASGNN